MAQRPTASGKRSFDSTLLRTLLAQWLAHGQKNWKPATYSLYEHLVRVHIAPAFHSRKVGSISTSNVRIWQHTMLIQGVGNTTRRRAQQIAAQALQPLVARGNLSRNAFRIAPIPEKPKPDVRVPTPSELRRLLIHTEETRTKAMILLSATTMLRIGEILDLKVNDVDLEHGRLRVPATVSRHPKTKLNSLSKAIPLPSIVTTEIRRYLREQGRNARRSDLLFPGARNKKLDRHNFRNRVWVPLLRATGIDDDIHFDSLRYAGSALLLQSGTTTHVVASKARLTTTRMILERHGSSAHKVREAAAPGTANRGLGRVGGPGKRRKKRH